MSIYRVRQHENRFLVVSTGSDGKEYGEVAAEVLSHLTVDEKILCSVSVSEALCITPDNALAFAKAVEKAGKLALELSQPLERSRI